MSRARLSAEALGILELGVRIVDMASKVSRAEGQLRGWCGWAQRSRLPEMIRVARTIRQNLEGILRWFTSDLTNALLEGINSLVQAARPRARGYRTAQNFIDVIYFLAGKLDFVSTH